MVARVKTPLVLVALALASCTPDPVTVRARQEQAIGRQMVEHPEQRDSLKKAMSKIWVQ